MPSWIGMQSWNKACEHDWLLPGIIHSNVIEDLFVRVAAWMSCYLGNAKAKQGEIFDYNCRSVMYRFEDGIV